MRNLLFTIFVFSQLCSCTTFNEFHHFKDRSPSQPNYYRINVKGYTLFYSKTRYWSGYFNEEAIRLYFNEFTQPKDGRLTKFDSSGVTSLIAENEDKKLVMLLSSNADDIAAQIGAMAENKETVESILGIANKENFSLLLDLKSKKEALVSSTSQKLDFWDSTVSTSLDSANTKRELFNYINLIADELGNTEPLTDWDKAKQWLKNYKTIKNK